MVVGGIDTHKPKSQGYKTLQTDIAGPLANGSTDTTNTTGTADVSDYDIITIEVHFTGVNGSTGNVTFFIGESVDGTNYSGVNNATQSPIQIVCAANGSNTVRQTAKIDVRGVKSIKLQGVYNSSGGNITNYGAVIGYNTY